MGDTVHAVRGTGLTRDLSSGFVFVADSGMPAVWRLSSEGELLSEVILQVEGMGQVAKIRKDLSSGFVACSTAWGRIGLMDIQVAALVKISNSFDIEWSQVKGSGGYISILVKQLTARCSDIRAERRHEPGVRHAGRLRG